MRARTSALLAFALAGTVSAAAAQTTVVSPPPLQAGNGRTWTNPLDLDYRPTSPAEGIAFRDGADPAVVLHRDRYYLFADRTAGYWTSRDLRAWRFVAPRGWPEVVEAPAAVSDGDRLWLLPAGKGPRPLLSSAVPETGDWRTEARPVAAPEGGLWSPNLFIDDDDAWRMYSGWSDSRPIEGVAVGAAPGLAALGAAQGLVSPDPERHGWERFGPDHSGGLPDGAAVRPFVDGAWMIRRGDRYYLQYAAPGVEYNTAATGAYVGGSALGPFEYAPYSPVGYKPGGFVQGAGHGSTFQDRYGNWWNAATAWVGLNWTFERRIALYPAGFHADGQMWISSRFADFPQRAADGPVTDPDSLFTGWMPLSYRAAASASSTLGDFTADRATDEDPRTFWVAAGRDAGETLTLDLGGLKTVQAVQVNYADHQAGPSLVGPDSPPRRTRFRIQWSADGQVWATFADRMSAVRDSPNAYVEGDRPVRARYVRYVHGEAPGARLAIADFRVFGNADGDVPAAPMNLRVSRGEDQRNAVVRFDRPAPNEGPRILGYNIRWGVRPDRLNLSYQVWADDLAARGGEIEIRALNVGVDYHFAVEAFGETGVSRLSETTAVPAGVITAGRTGDAAPLGRPQPGAPGDPPASGVRVVPIPPVYISGAPPVTGRDLPPTGATTTEGTAADPKPEPPKPTPPTAAETPRDPTAG